MGLSIKISDLNKTFGKVAALDHVNLTVEAGDFVVLLGPSGCGKTTLLRCIAGLEMPDQGEILIGEQLVYSGKRGIAVAPAKRNVGMVFQSYALWPHMSVYDNIGFGLTLQKMSQKEVRKRVDHVLTDLGMEGLGNRYPSELSGGQQQRVAVSRLLATKPPVFLMDEPLSNLDARLRLDMRSELKRLHHDTGVTTIYVTHDQTEAMTMASCVVVIKEGRIQQIAPPGQLYEKPANIFVAEFVGMPRINALETRINHVNGQCWLEADDLKIPGPAVEHEGDVIAAVRPEDIRIHLEPEAEALAFQIYSVLPSGPELFVQVRRNDRTLIIRETNQLDLKMDQQVWIKIDPESINLYDRTTGLLIT